MSDMTELKQYLKDNCENPKFAYDFIQKQAFLDKLYDFAIQHKHREGPTPRGFGNVNAAVVLVLPDLHEKTMVAYFRKILDILHIDFLKVYVTSWDKATKDKDDEILLQEIKAIQPSYAICIGGPSGVVPVPRAEFPYGEMQDIVRLDLVKERTPEQEALLVEKKTALWASIKDVLKYI